MRFTSRIFTIFLVFLSFSCAPISSESLLAPTSQCNSDTTAMILIQDGFLQNVCGCDEGEVAFAASETLTCTISTSTTVIFDYSNSQFSHQVISSGSPSFNSSPIHDPYLHSNNNLTYAVTFTKIGTYQFFDAFNEALTGQIIVE